MLTKDNYEDDLRYVIEPNRNVLLSLGIRVSYLKSENQESNLQKCLRYILIIINIILILYVVIPGILHICLKETSTYAKLRIVVPIMYSSMSLAKYIVLFFSIEKINLCLKHVRDDWENTIEICTRDMMKKKAAVGRRFFVICGALMYGSGLLFRGIIPLTRGQIIVNENLTIRPLPCPCYFLFFDPQISPAYEIVYFLQCVSGIITYSITTAVCGLAALFVLHICGQLEILTMLMNRMVEKSVIQGGVNIDEKIAKTVEHQVKVQKFVQDLFLYI
ncbi:hypothetical protein M0802_007264 [Mischocyttarus mexicanus]|nr:hypothetical protein M0802_007264 [Mischocyttarus mexicanus]